MSNINVLQTPEAIRAVGASTRLGLLPDPITNEIGYGRHFVGRAIDELGPYGKNIGIDRFTDEIMLAIHEREIPYSTAAIKMKQFGEGYFLNPEQDVK